MFVRPSAILLEFSDVIQPSLVMVRASSPGRAESLEELVQRRQEEVQAAMEKAEPNKSFYAYDTFDPSTIKRKPINEYEESWENI